MGVKSLASHHAMKAAIALGFAMLIVYLVRTDNLVLYIAPRMMAYVKWSAVGLYAVGMYELWLAVTTLWGKTADCDCAHPPSRSVLKNIVVYGLFVLPLALGFLLPNSTLGTAMAAKKGMNLSSSASIRKEVPPPSQPQPQQQHVQPSDPGSPPSNGSRIAPVDGVTDAKLNELFKADKFTEAYAEFGKKLYRQPVLNIKEPWYIETLNTVDLYLDNFVGKKMEIGGFVYRQDGLSDNQFVVGRFAMSCCSADAAPFGVLVEYDRAKMWANDTWVKVSGTLRKTTFENQEVMLLKVDAVTKLDTPKDRQYIYPNPDFGL